MGGKQDPEANPQSYGVCVFGIPPQNSLFGATPSGSLQPVSLSHVHFRRGQQTLSSEENQSLKLETNFFLNSPLLGFYPRYLPSMYQSLRF